MRAAAATSSAPQQQLSPYSLTAAASVEEGGVGAGRRRNLSWTSKDAGEWGWTSKDAGEWGWTSKDAGEWGCLPPPMGLLHCLAPRCPLTLPRLTLPHLTLRPLLCAHPTNLYTLPTYTHP